MNARTRALASVAAVVGLLLAASLFPAAAQARLGDLDPHFGEGGIVKIPTETASCRYPHSVHDVEVGAAGILTADYGGILRFDLSGEVNTHFGERSGPPAECPVVSGGASIRAQGSRLVAFGGGTIERLSRTGIRDPTFGHEGRARFSAEELADGAVAPDERIVAGGVSRFVHAQPVFERYLPDGRRDASFGFDGIARLRTPFDRGAEIAAVALQPDGGVLGVGQATSRRGEYQIYLVRLRPDGVRDRRFGSSGNGVVQIHGGEYSLGVSVLAQEGRIYVLGTNEDVGSGSRVILARFLPDGRPDRSFGRRGLVRYPIFDMQPTDMAIYHGMPVVSGWAGSHGCGDHGACMVLARFTRRGEIDRSFGRNGVVRTAVGREAFGESVAVQPDGDVLLGGTANIGEGRVAVLARYFGHEARN